MQLDFALKRVVVYLVRILFVQIQTKIFFPHRVSSPRAIVVYLILEAPQFISKVAIFMLPFPKITSHFLNKIDLLLRLLLLKLYDVEIFALSFI